MVTNKQVFLDANILLEILLDRPKNKLARKYLAKNAGNMHISALTAHLVTHFGKDFIDLPVLRLFLKDYFVEALTEEDFDWAFLNSRDADFEDALQLAVAIRTNCQEFITFDKTLFNAYKELPTIKVVLLK